MTINTQTNPAQASEIPKISDWCFRMNLSGRYLGQTGHSGPLKPDEFAFLVIPAEPYGEWGEWRAFGSGEQRYRSSVTVWVAVRDIKIPRCHYYEDLPLEVKVGELFSHISNNYYRELRGFPPNHDICGYCGADNTSADGKTNYRNGWDCCNCGGGLAYLSTVTDRDGRIKDVLGGHTTPELVREWMAACKAEGREVYGDPVRGFAGAYHK